MALPFRPVSGQPPPPVGGTVMLPSSYRGPGLRVRFTAVEGVTKKGVLTTPLYLPAALGDFAFDEEFDWRDYTTIADGEYSVAAQGGETARRLRTSDLETLTIDWHRYARWLTNPQVTPQVARRELYRIGRTHSVFELLAILQLGSDEPEELRMKASIRSIRRVLRPGEADTRYYSLSIKEHRNNDVERRGASTTGSSGGADGRGNGTGGARPVKLPAVATLTAETSLHSLAGHFYGSEAAWRPIAAANGIKNWGAAYPLAKSPRWKVGDKVKIPKPSATTDVIDF